MPQLWTDLIIKKSSLITIEKSDKTRYNFQAYIGQHVIVRYFNNNSSTHMKKTKNERNYTWKRSKVLVISMMKDTKLHRSEMKHWWPEVRGISKVQLKELLTCTQNHRQCQFQSDRQFVPRNPSPPCGTDTHCNTSFWSLNEENQRVSTLTIWNDSLTFMD